MPQSLNLGPAAGIATWRAASSGGKAMTKADASRLGKALAAIGAFAAVTLATACGGSPTTPSNSGASGAGGSAEPPVARVSVVATETFSGQPVSVDYVVDCGTQKTAGRTNAERITTPAGRCEIRVGMDLGNNRTTDQLVPVVYKNLTLAGDFVLETDLARYAALFGTPHDPKYIIETYYGQGSSNTPGGTNATLGKWTHRPTKFIIWNDPANTPANMIEFGNANFSRYLAMMKYVEEFTGGLITVPLVDEIAIKNELPAGIEAPDFNPSRAQFEPDSYNFINPAVLIAREWSFANAGGIQYSAPLAPIRDANFPSAVAEAINSAIQGNGESSPRGNGSYVCVLDNLGRRNQLDENWIKGLIYGDGGSGKRKNGDRFLPSGDSVPSQYGFPYEERQR